jgi:hypothetical protein
VRSNGNTICEDHRKCFPSATSDAKTKENVSLELRFVNSSLQLLKEQLAELNSSVELYQDRDRW